jgi:hypothetical protein
MEIDGFTVPKLVRSDDDRLVIEMGIVSPPFILDFGKAYREFRPSFPPEVWADWENQQREWWGEPFQQVQSIHWQLERIGIHYTDPKPGNIMFENWDDRP